MQRDFRLAQEEDFARIVSIFKRAIAHMDFQHQGIAKETIRCVERMLAARGYSSIRLDAFSKNASVLKMYKGLGYAQIGEITFRKGLFYLFLKRAGS
jgi:hypothetical protein